MDSLPFIQAWPPLRSAAIHSTRPISEHLWLEWLSACLASSVVSNLFWLPVYFWSFIHSCFDGKPTRSFIINSGSRSLGVPALQYIDDRRVGQLFISPLRVSRDPFFERAQAAASTVLSAHWGWMFHWYWKKFKHVFFNMGSFSRIHMRFCASGLLRPRRQENQIRSVEGRHLFLSCPGAKTLQRFLEKVISFSLVIPGCCMCPTSLTLFRLGGGFSNPPPPPAKLW